MDIWEYFETRDREVKEMSLGWAGRPVYTEEAGSNGQRGRVWGQLVIDEHAFLQVSEVVEVTGTGIHRVEYAYYLVIDGQEMWGVERALSHEPTDHEHDRDHTRQSCDPISFKQAVERAWETSSNEAELRETTE